ncbi:hypothetical protein QVD17_38873 [Tagetes erecta]|uniref:CALMODULIN-BINDING PROTEIN60 n=1 Tax=Tagetes erecta TaxID=13708 RepID=A0AAD8JML2_TARER|nr:hypothetical protein QVD17_38873 [Tagetes erecta]
MDRAYGHQNLQFDHKGYAASSKPTNYLKLIFSTQVSSPVFTTQNITGKASGDDGNNSIKVILVDSNTRETITTGLAASAKVKMVLLRGDYDGSTKNEFVNNIVVDWEKKKNIFLGDVYVNLEHGCGTVGNIRIKHDSNHLKNVKFRLGAMMVNCPTTYVVNEAISDPFVVKDIHIIPKRLRPLSLEDNVGKLVNISIRRTSNIRKRLEHVKVVTVSQFLKMYSSNSHELQKICGIKGKRWEQTVNHAKTSLNGNVLNESNTFTFGDYEDSIEFDNDDYIPSRYEDDVSLLEAPSFSTGEVEVCEAIIKMEGNGVKAKKRWMKLRFSLFIMKFRVV